VKPLPPSELFPAGSSDITQRTIALASGVSVRVAEGGPAGGTPVVLLPGWASPVYMYRHAFTLLGERGFRVIASDLRGFGLSDKPQRAGAYTLREYIADLDALLDALSIRRALLVGQSMAGGLVMHFALEQPERVQRFVLINPTGLVRTRFLWLLRLLPAPLLKIVGESMVPRWAVRFILEQLVFAEPSHVKKQDVDQYWSATQQRGYAFAARSALGEFDWTPITAETGGALAVPGMVILGQADRLVLNTAANVRKLRGVAVYTLPGGHSVQEEQPDEAYRLIAEFFGSAGNK
jgi:pimeloyl-ACP methyl ester carboxylesterase